LAAELQRVENHESLNALDSTRYQVPGPLSADASVEDWEKAVKNARAQMEHQGLRSALHPVYPLYMHLNYDQRASNVSLLQNYGSNTWRVHNYLLESDAVQLEKQVELLKERVTEVNRSRKNFQVGLGERLTGLERKWTDLISTVLQIELANVALEGEIEVLRAKEVELNEIVNG
jgi:pre-mRNA-splicing factor SPF27